MSTYLNNYIGKDDQNAVLQEVSRDGQVLESGLGYDQALTLVESQMAQGDTYEEADLGEVYCRQSYQDFIAGQEKTRAFIRGEI